jgi:Tol biopolymer transport system component
MTFRSDWQRVQELFHAALDVPQEARLAFVKQRADDRLMFDEVASLLAAYPAAEGFLSAPADPVQLAAAIAQLRPGDRLGAFEVLSLIGVGGMGEVYRARDTRLDREVAIKVLSSDFGQGDGRERLEREGRAIAKLTHPRISTLHDVGSASIGGVDASYLVMELVDGETLAARLRGGPLPLDQALSVAIDVAEALVAAHAAGIVHRDLKPANVMLTRSGAKLLDFGLARLRASLATGDPSVALSGAPLRNESAVIGTPAYMAPEQLQGAGADARSDLFAFGAMLYEMISGSRPFDAGSQAELVAAILGQEPVRLSTRVVSVPPSVERLVTTCLAKDPGERWQTAKDLLRELRWVRGDWDSRTAPSANAPKVLRPRFAVAATVAVSAAIAMAVGLVGVTRQGRQTAARISFPVYPPAGTRFPRGAAEMAVSPDGSRLVFVALSGNGRRKLWLRRFDAVDSRSIDGSEDAEDPFWSPDGRSIAFFAHHKLKRIAEAGGVPQEICDVLGGPRGGAWNRDGTILFGAFGYPVTRVADAGGVPTQVTAFVESRAERQHGWPVFLPDGQHFLYLAQSNDPARTAIYEGTLGSKETRPVFAADSGVGVAGQYLLTLSKGLLIARAYDAGRAQVGGAPTTIAEGMVYDPPQRSGPAFSVAASGVVAFRSASPNSRLTWFDRSGRELDSFPVRADYHHPWFSPDEKRIAIEKTDPATERHTLWILDPSRGTTSRLLLDPGGAHEPVWSPDGRRIVFASNRLGGIDLYAIEPDGGGSGALVLNSKEKASLVPTDWSLDGRFLMYQTMGRGQHDLMVLPLSPKQDPQPFLDTTAQEIQGQFSPDVHWVAYTSDESGSPEVYVRRFPVAGGKWQISTHGGGQPRWRRDGRELFYLAPDGRLMSVAVKADPNGIETSQPRELFNTGITASFLDRRNQYVVTRDGERFLVNISAEDESSAPITVVMNWDGVRHN